MSEATHTPGPWVIDERVPWIIRPNLSSFDYIAAVPVSNSPNWEADARLIAAAPDLKAFAEGVLVYTVEGDPEHVWLRFGGADIVVHKTTSAEGVTLLKMEAARREALAKAEGGT